MSKREVPEPWASRMIEMGFTDPRYTVDVPSLSRLAEACDSHTSTISAAIKGSGRKPSALTVAALVRELGGDVAGWLGVERSAAWEPPAEAALLTDRQRKAVEEIIRAMTERREDVGNDERSASTSKAGSVTQLQPVEDSDLPTGLAARTPGEEPKGRRARRVQDEDADRS